MHIRQKVLHLQVLDIQVIQEHLYGLIRNMRFTYIFLSNRVYPTRNNNLITELNIRSDILQAIYDSIIR